GCSEQLVSTALPLLYADVLGGASGADPDRAVRPRVQEAVNSLLNRQGTDGAFGLWRIGDRAATPWIGAYVTEFLQRAKSEGYGVPDAALEKAYQALADFSEPNRFTPVNYRRRAYEGPGSNDSTANLRRRAAAYAHYVLARAGRADLSDLRYFHDGLLDATPSPLARAHIAAALALSGDVARAESAFQKSLHVIGFENTGDYYQTALRDVAGVLALASETGRGAVVSAASAAFDQRLKEPERMQTQEKAFVLIASQALLRAAGPLNISVDGERIANVAAPSFSPALRSLGGDGVTYTNLSDGPIFRTVTASGAPLQAPPQVFSGFNAVKFIANRDGTRADLLNIKQNDQLVIAISGQASGERLHPAIVADLLPPGFEIVTVLRPEDGGSARGEGGGPYSWIGPISRAKIAEARDDRFVAAIDVRRERFTFAYVVRAVTPGDFVVPGVVIEDMYRPGVVGRTAASRVQISAANE
ncbi:MAG: alpha-2-macroglobulin family protein, partial [Pseudomonadota bacterium]